jgi:hypothetical protein
MHAPDNLVAWAIRQLLDGIGIDLKLDDAKVSAHGASAAQHSAEKITKSPPSEAAAHIIYGLFDAF